MVNCIYGIYIFGAIYFKLKRFKPSKLKAIDEIFHRQK